MYCRFCILEEIGIVMVVVVVVVEFCEREEGFFLRWGCKIICLILY